VRPLQSADDSGLDESACLTVKNIGKPCAGKPHARFDEGGQGETCSLLYPDGYPSVEGFNCFRSRSVVLPNRHSDNEIIQNFLQNVFAVFNLPIH